MAGSQPWSMVGGATNFTKSEAQRFARQMLQSQTYRDDLERRLLSGTLAPAIETMLWHYAYGKPIEQINLNVSQQEDLSQLSVQELFDRAKKLSDALEEAQQLEAALPTEFKVTA